jgi:predicted neuraminidase
MSRISCLCWTLLVAAAGAEISAAADSAIIQSGFINERASYPSCHASTIVETEPGKLVAAWFGGTHEKHPDVGIWLAHHEGDGWTPAREVANGLQEDGSRHPTWNPVLFQPRGGPLLLFYKVGPSPQSWWGMVMESRDGGQTWSPARRLPDGILGPIKNKPVQLHDGVLLSSSSTEDQEGWRLHFERSLDGGATWTATPPLPSAAGFNAIQASVLSYPDGRLQALARSREGVVVQTWSSDQGRTWTDVTATGLPNPNSGTDAVTLADGRQLIVYNHSSAGRQKAPRYPLNVALSDDGQTWQPAATLEHAPNEHGYSYPAVIQAHDGRIHITYTWDRRVIKHVIIDPARLGSR